MDDEIKFDEGFFVLKPMKNATWYSIRNMQDTQAIHYFTLKCNSISNFKAYI